MPGAPRARIVFIFVTVLIDMVSVGLIMPVLPSLVALLGARDRREAYDPVVRSWSARASWILLGLLASGCFKRGSGAHGDHDDVCLGRSTIPSTPATRSPLSSRTVDDVVSLNVQEATMGGTVVTLDAPPRGAAAPPPGSKAEAPLERSMVGSPSGSKVTLMVSNSLSIEVGGAARRPAAGVEWAHETDLIARAALPPERVVLATSGAAGPRSGLRIAILEEPVDIVAAAIAQSMQGEIRIEAASADTRGRGAETDPARRFLREDTRLPAPVR